MNYHLNRNGQNLGIFPFEDLQRRYAAGELTGTELVWCEGMPGWLPLSTVLASKAGRFSGVLNPAAAKARMRRNLIITAVVALCVLLAFGIQYAVNKAARLIRPVLSQVRTASANNTPTRGDALQAASQPMVIGSNTLTVADVMKVQREFRVRQYLEGYQLRGQRNPECDFVALGFITNWIAENYGGVNYTNLPSTGELADRLATDTNCTDPLLLTIAAINSVELHESNRRLERAVKGFENSKHLGYPKFCATVSLAEKLINDRLDRLPALDALALKDLQAALTDGSLRATDQAEIADVLVLGWGKEFFDRNAVAVHQMVQNQGADFTWLALVLDGENEISEAWRSRGGGFADSVSDAGQKGFSDHLEAASHDFKNAYKLHPELPLAPARMIYVSLGNYDITEMRRWFDLATADQLDYGQAWRDLRWGLRPRWYGDLNSMLALGVTALNTRRFDTGVPRMYFDSLSDVESEMKLAPGEHIYARADIWPHLQEMYEGYIAEPSLSDYNRDSWRSAYAVIAYLAGKYDVARKQLEAMNWQPHGWNLTSWQKDLTLLPLEVAARTGSKSNLVTQAERARQKNDLAPALKLYHQLADDSGADKMTASFVRERLASLEVEQRLATGEWVPFMPDATLTGWNVELGKCTVLPDGSLEVKSDQNGHLMYSRARMGTNFEVRGQFELVSSTSSSFQGGLVMGLPQFSTVNWFGFRIKRHSDEGDIASFSSGWTKRQVMAPVRLDSRTNSFDFRYQGGRVTASVNGEQVLAGVEPPPKSYVSADPFYLGLGAFNDSNSSVIRYRNIEVRKHPSP